jgi:hypothetical protein
MTHSYLALNLMLTKISSPESISGLAKQKFLTKIPNQNTVCSPTKTISSHHHLHAAILIVPSMRLLLLQWDVGEPKIFTSGEQLDWGICVVEESRIFASSEQLDLGICVVEESRIFASCTCHGHRWAGRVKCPQEEQYNPSLTIVHLDHAWRRKVVISLKLKWQAKNK